MGDDGVAGAAEQQSGQRAVASRSDHDQLLIGIVGVSQDRVGRLAGTIHKLGFHTLFIKDFFGESKNALAILVLQSIHLRLVDRIDDPISLQFIDG